jgi:hypothetical protein
MLKNHLTLDLFIVQKNTVKNIPSFGEFAKNSGGEIFFYESFDEKNSKLKSESIL